LKAVVLKPLWPKEAIQKRKDQIVFWLPWLCWWIKGVFLFLHRSTGGIFSEPQTLKEVLDRLEKDCQGLYKPTIGKIKKKPWTVCKKNASLKISSVCKNQSKKETLSDYRITESFSKNWPLNGALSVSGQVL